MRTAAAMVCLMVVAAMPSGAQSSGATAAARRLAAAREAIGGGGRLQAITSLVIRGQARHRNQHYKKRPGATREWIDRTLEVRASWPDHFLMIGTLDLAGRRVEHREGFAGQSSLAAKVQAASYYQIEFARRMLLLLLRTDTVFPLTAVSTAGRSGALEFTGAHEFHAHLEIDPQTRFPTRLRSRHRRFDGQGRLATGMMPWSVVTVERRVAVGGLTVPDRLRYSDDEGQTLAIETYSSLQFNSPLTSADFRR